MTIVSLSTLRFPPPIILIHYPSSIILIHYPPSIILIHNPHPLSSIHYPPSLILSSEGGPYCELGLPGGPDMHTLSMDDFQVVANIMIVDICWQFCRKGAHSHKKYREYFSLPQTLPSELQAQEVLIFTY